MIMYDPRRLLEFEIVNGLDGRWLYRQHEAGRGKESCHDDHVG